MRERGRGILRAAALAVPFFLGVAGFLLSGEALLDSAFITLCMYGMGYPDPIPNLLVEIARWTAPLAAVGGILLLFQMNHRLKNWVHSFRKDSVAVYGPDRDEVLSSLGKRGIDGGDGFSFRKAGSYILLGNEEENFDFYRQNRSALKGHTVCLECCFLPAQSASDPELRLFREEETAARLYWKEHCIHQLSVRCGHQMKIVFLGFGVLGEELLSCALQDNIFHPDQKIEYHIFGDGDRFLAIHPELPSIDDPVIFHGEPWYEQMPLLEEAQSVIVLSEEEQLDLVKDLLLATKRASYDVFTSRRELELLAGQERLNLFYWKEQARKPEYLMGDTLFDRAKRINLRYAALYNNVAETEEAKEQEWEKLDAFTRYSNISSADYHEVRLIMLADMGQDAEHPAPDCMELLSELEHIRWCRYHYLNNWKYGVPENGKRKDPVQKIHADLVPYRDLTEGEKEKDRENIRILLSMNKGGRKNYGVE